MKEYTIEQQIKVITLAIKLLTEIPLPERHASRGLCWSISKAAYQFGYTFDKAFFYHSRFMGECIPLLVKCNKYNPDRDGTKSSYWWPKEDKEIRIEFLDHILTELTNQTK